MFRSILLSALLAGVLAPAAASAAPGSVTLVRTADSADTAAEQAFLRKRMWRLHGTTAWHPGTWTRKSAFALDPDSPEAAAHPEWILKDAWGNRLYIGTDYAADFGDPSYRAWWIAQAVAQVSGFRGLLIDDVAMERRARYSFGWNATPRDPRTNTNMSEATWQRYMADFMVEVRAALPSTEIVHDVVWQKGAGNTHLQRQLAAADHIALEPGFTDTAVAAGSGRNGWQTLAGFIEARQAEGHRVIINGWSDSAHGTLFGLASYLLTDQGGAALGNDAATDPASFWSGYEVRLGAPRGGRRPWQGVWRRDFADGMVLVNEPRAAPVTVEVGPGFADHNGTRMVSVTLPGGGGAVLRRVPVSAPPPAPAGEVPPATAATSEPPMPTTTAQRPSTLTTRGAGARGPRSTRTSAVLSSRRVYGRVRGATGGAVRVTVQRRSGRRWRTALRANASVSRRGAYERAISRLRRGTYRVSARFLGTGTARPSTSSYARRSL
jgi:hypothetical protein